MLTLSKSKLLAYRQCPKRLWLEVHRPELRDDSPQTQASFQAGHAVGDVARRLYDPKGLGTFLDISELGVGGMVHATRQLLSRRAPIFEAAFSIGHKEEGALAIADVLLPDPDGRAWHMVEVKSSTQVKDYHMDDAAIQFYIATQAGVPLGSIKVAHIDSSWVYPGDGVYQGLLREADLSAVTAAREHEVRDWLAGAHEIVRSEAPPERDTGTHCRTPYECGFLKACRGDDDRRHGIATHPVHWLPMQGARGELKALLNGDSPPRDMAQVPDAALNDRQRRVKEAHLSGRRFLDAAGAQERLAVHSLPALFLDFETVAHTVPIWKGTRPYQQIPFQFSLHRLSPDGTLTHLGFLDLSGSDPSLQIAMALVASCGTREPIYAYNKSFEGARLQELAMRFPQLQKGLMDIQARLVDLRPIAESCYYDPAQEGSWSIKSVLPTIAPDLAYDKLGAVHDGGAAMGAYLEAIGPEVTAERKQQVRDALWRYCRLDTYAMVRLWGFFSGRADLVPPEDDCTSSEATA